MTEFQRRIQLAAESILENEALTAALDDEAAKLILAWGLEQSQGIVSETIEMDDAQAEEAIYHPMRALRKMLRIANQWTIEPQENSLRKFLQQVEIVYGCIPSEEQQALFMLQIPEGSVERVAALRSFVEGERRDPYRN